MPSRIFMKGRNIAVSRSYRRLVKPAFSERVDPDRTEEHNGQQIYAPTEQLPEFPPEWPHVHVVGRPYFDKDDKLNYRLIDKLRLEEGWCTADQLVDHYKINYAELLDWARRGVVDPAMEFGCPTKRYRVLQPNHASQRAKAFRAKQRRKTP